jgi:hypothetical protein
MVSRAKATHHPSRAVPQLMFPTTQIHGPTKSPNPRRRERTNGDGTDGKGQIGDGGQGALPAGELDDARALGEGDVADAENGEDAAHGVAAGGEAAWDGMLLAPPVSVSLSLDRSAPPCS